MGKNHGENGVLWRKRWKEQGFRKDGRNGILGMEKDEGNGILWRKRWRKGDFIGEKDGRDGILWMKTWRMWDFMGEN